MEASKSKAAAEIFPPPTPYEISSRVIRVCLYYETAINLACSIVDIFWDLLAKLDPESKSRGGQAGFQDRNPSFDFRELEFDPVVKDFINDNIAVFQDLWHHRDKVLFETSAMISSVDSKDPDLALLQVFSIAFQVEQRIDGACIFIQSFLRFADKYLASKVVTNL